MTDLFPEKSEGGFIAKVHLRNALYEADGITLKAASEVVTKNVVVNPSELVVDYLINGIVNGAVVTPSYAFELQIGNDSTLNNAFDVTIQ